MCGADDDVWAKGDAEDEGRWVALVHVCQRWRYIVFASPHRLDLRLVCTARTPVRETLHVWPALPIAVRISDPYEEIPDNVVAALEHKDRVCEIFAYDILGDEFEELATVPVTQDPFPALAHLYLDAYPEYINLKSPIIPDSFLGGSAPLLRSLYLRNFEYPALPKLLLSATGLVSLSLFDRSCHISPQVMVDYLTSLTRLEELQFGFRLGRPREGSRRPSPHLTPLTRRTDLRLLPVLATLVFEGATEYFDDIFTHIDVPRLKDISIEFVFNPPIFELSRIFLFTRLKETFEALDHVHMGIANHTFVNIILSSRRGTTGGKMVMMLIPPTNDESNWKFWRLIQDRRYPTSLVLSPANFECPKVEGKHTLHDVGNDQWLELFRLFSAVGSLYLSETLAMCVAPALRGLVGGGVTEVLPALQNLFIINF